MVCSVIDIFRFIYFKKNGYYIIILGSTKRISNTDVVNYLMHPSSKQQLSTMGVENIFPYAGFTEDNLREYYENPPAGMKILHFSIKTTLYCLSTFYETLKKKKISFIMIISIDV